MSKTRWAIVDTIERWDDLHAQIAAFKNVDGTKSEVYTEVFVHPNDKNLLALTVNPEDAELARQLLTPEEASNFKTLSEMLAEGWFPSPKSSPGSQSLQPTLATTVTPPPAEEIPRMHFLQRHGWKVAGAVAAASAAAAAVVAYHYFG